MVRAGQLRHRVAIQRLTLTKDAIGGDVQTPSTVATVWGAVRPVSGREALEGQRLASTASHFITIRYRPDVTPQMRAVWRGRTFEISQVENTDTRDEQLVLWCTEVQGQIGAVA